MADLVKIFSLNCRGLQDYRMQKDVFNYLRQKRYISKLCLQDTHFAAKDQNSERVRWVAEVYSSPGKINAKGFSTSLSKNFEYKVIDSLNDDVEIVLLIR